MKRIIYLAFLLTGFVATATASPSEVNEKILKAGVINKPIHASSAYETATNDWRYLTAAFFI